MSSNTNLNLKHRCEICTQQINPYLSDCTFKGALPKGKAGFFHIKCLGNKPEKAAAEKVQFKPFVLENDHSCSLCHKSIIGLRHKKELDRDSFVAGHIEPENKIFHVFHHKCLQQYIDADNASCPRCKVLIDNKDAYSARSKYTSVEAKKNNVRFQTLKQIKDYRGIKDMIKETATTDTGICGEVELLRAV